MVHSTGIQFREALKQPQPLQLVGVINPLIAIMAQQVGFKAIYLSGAGVANADLGLPDLGLTSLDDVLLSVRRITSRSTLPLIVDADTGWGSPLNVERTFFELSKAGAAGAHIEDQDIFKRCGHRPGKKLVSTQDMVARIKAAIQGRVDDSFVVIARTDALAVEGVESAIERAIAYEQAGADVIFVEAVTELAVYQQFAKQLSVPILANITEFGKTPLFTLDQLASVGVKVALYPLSIFRAMNLAALNTLQALKSEGTQSGCIENMQTRDALYSLIDYQQFETSLDRYLNNKD